MSDITYEDVRVSYLFSSLSQLVESPIKDVYGYFSTFYGKDPVFKISQIEFKNGHKLYIEGEHDFPYCVDMKGAVPNYDEETLQRLYDEQTLSEM